MKKLFLTSGLVICLVCPVFADTEVTGSGNECVYDTLGTYTGPSTLVANWEPIVSGAITLDSKKYSSATATSGTTATTAAAPATVYVKFDTSVHNGTPVTTSNEITALTTNAALKGHTFAGFYTAKAGTGTQVINSSGTFLDAAKTQVSTAGGTTTWYAHYTPNISGAITLNSNYYTSSSASTATYTASPAAETTPLYSVYNYGIYTTKPTLSNYTSATKYTQLTTLPQITGYTFGGFYTTKGGTGTQVIDASGSILSAAKTRVTAVNGTKTWYAKWTPNERTITYTCGDKPTGCTSNFTANRSAPAAATLNYDSTYTISAAPDASTSCELPGYHFKEWSCNYNLDTGASGATVYAPGASNTFKVDANVTCKVVWEANSITLTWNDNGATTAHAGGGATCSYDSGITIPTTPPELTGYTFDGWIIE